MRSWLDLACRIATYEPKFRSHLFTSLLLAALLAIITQAALLTQRLGGQGRSYQLASAYDEGLTFNVRFVPQTHVADLDRFLEVYGAYIVSGPLPGGWYYDRRVAMSYLQSRRGVGFYTTTWTGRASHPSRTVRKPQTQ